MQLIMSQSKTVDELEDCCPECGELSIQRKTGPPENRKYPEAWWCSNGHHFDEPDRRARKRDGVAYANSPLVKRLMDADPDSV